MTNDLISRRKLDGMRLAVPDFVNPDQRTKGWNECITYIQQKAPAVDAAPVVHGRWIKKPFLLGTTNVCDKCGEYYGMPHGMFNYCPNCGAKMDREECMDA